MNQIARITVKHGQGPTALELSEVTDRARQVVQQGLDRMVERGLLLKRMGKSRDRVRGDGTSAGQRPAWRYTVTAAGHRWLEAGRG